MRKTILFVSLLAVIMGIYTMNVFSATDCQYYQFIYASSGGDHYSYHVRTENYEHPYNLDVSTNNSSPSDKLSVSEMSGFTLGIDNAKGERVAFCLYGLHGDVVQNPGEAVSCPTLIPKKMDDGVCQISLPSDLSPISP